MLSFSLQLSAGTFATSVCVLSVPSQIDELCGENWFSKFLIVSFVV